MKQQKTCPQCEGSGQEELGVTPIICRKCHGAGNIDAISKTAISNKKTLYKMAQDFGQFMADEMGENENDEEGFLGSGVDELAANVGSMSDEDLKFSIMQFMKSMSSSQLYKLFERVFAVLGSSAEEAKNIVVDPDTGDQNDFQIVNYIAQTIDTMTNKQLRSMYCETRRFA